MKIKGESLVIRNSDNEKKWDKPVVVPDSIENYYKILPDKRLFDMAKVVLVEEEDRYVLIKNIWKYTKDMKMCRNLSGRLFNVEDIEFIKVRARDFVCKYDIQKEDIPQNIIICNIFQES